MSSGTRIGMVRCEHCGRQFNPHSAARHIPWCEKQKQERNKHRLSNEKKQALERYKWRISYRPTNRLNNPNRNRPTALNTTLDHNHNQSQSFGRQKKKSSVNSSATLSSPSASSSASLGGTSSIVSINNNNNNNDGNRRQVNRITGKRQQQQQQHQNSASSVGQLQRSISSLTLTKNRQGFVIGDDDTTQWDIGSDEASNNNTNSNARFNRNSQVINNNNNNKQQQQLMRQRTKSTNDLSNMGEMVETLAKRVDEIYAQNQILLANFPKNGISLENNNNNNNNNNSATEEDSDNELLVKCHHCKADCYEEANYCHRCGCKLCLTSPSSPG